VTDAGVQVIAVFYMLVAKGNVQVFPGSVKDRLDGKLPQGAGKIEAPAGTPDRRNDPRLPELEKDLFKEHGRNILGFRQDIYRYRRPILAKFCQRQSCPERVTAPCGNSHGVPPPFPIILSIIIMYYFTKVHVFFRKKYKFSFLKHGAYAYLALKAA
jgi:hypothetical protein